MTVLRQRKTWAKERNPTEVSRSRDLTPEQEANVRAALAVLRIRFGSFAKVAEAMGVQRKIVERHARGSNRTTAGLAIKTAKLAGVPVDDVLTGSFPVPGACPMCGRCD